MEPSGKDEASSSKDTMNCALPDAPLPNVEPDAGPRLQDLPDAVLGLIWRMLDTESQHRWMQASKAIATSPAVLAQIDGINVVGEEPVSQLLRFPRKASLRRLGATQLAGICSTLQAWADDRRCRLLLYGLQELRVRVELPSTVSFSADTVGGLLQASMRHASRLGPPVVPCHRRPRFIEARAGCTSTVFCNQEWNLDSPCGKMKRVAVLLLSLAVQLACRRVFTLCSCCLIAYIFINTCGLCT